MSIQSPPPANLEWTQINAWRKSMRKQWIEWRNTVPEEVRDTWNRRMTDHLDALFPQVQDVVIGFCWPYQSEFDARHLMRRLCGRGAVAALPEVVGKALPLLFRKWWPGAPMKRGVYDIPYPDQTPLLQPVLLLVPMVACDQRGFRLGYGGGYFDRTLAQPGGRAITVGVTYAATIIDSIYPQAHDIAMDFVVTEEGILAMRGQALQRVEADAAALQLQGLLKGAAK